MRKPFIGLDLEFVIWNGISVRLSVCGDLLFIIDAYPVILFRI